MLKKSLPATKTSFKKDDVEIDDVEPVDVVIIAGRHSDLITAKKSGVILERLNISYKIKVICPIRSNKKFKNYVKSHENAKLFIGISSNSSQVTGALVGLTDRPVIGVPCVNEIGNDYLLTVVNMPPGVPVGSVGINNARNAAILAAEILSINNDEITELLGKIKNKKLNL